MLKETGCSHNWSCNWHTFGHGVSTTKEVQNVETCETRETCENGISMPVGSHELLPKGLKVGSLCSKSPCRPTWWVFFLTLQMIRGQSPLMGKWWVPNMKSYNYRCSMADQTLKNWQHLRIHPTTSRKYGKIWEVSQNRLFWIVISEDLAGQLLNDMISEALTPAAWEKKRDENSNKSENENWKLVHCGKFHCNSM